MSEIDRMHCLQEENGLPLGDHVIMHIKDAGLDVSHGMACVMTGLFDRTKSIESSHVLIDAEGDVIVVSDLPKETAMQDVNAQSVREKLLELFSDATIEA